MLHELVMCLLGNTGGIFQYKLENNSSKIKLADNLDYIHPAEVEICNRLAELGTNYAKLNKFVNLYAFAKIISNQKLKQGIYIATFCNAIEATILTPYRLLIGELEKDLLKESFYNVTFLQTNLEHYYLIFQTLSNLIDDIEAGKVHGCQILTKIYRCTQTGNANIKELMNKILCICNQAFYKQLRDWMIFGLLRDKYSEFIICHKNTKNESEVVPKNETIASDDTSIQTTTLEQVLASQQADSSYFSQYILNANMYPIFLDQKVADKILFVGEALQLFHVKSNLSDTTLDESQLQAKLKSDKSLRQELDLMNEKLDDFAKEIYVQSMENTFEITEFEALVERIRKYVSESTWNIIVNKYALAGELQKLKDMYFLGRGELFATFADALKDFMARQSKKNALTLKPQANESLLELNVPLIFQQSITRMLLENDTCTSQFNLKINPDKSLGNEVWSRIELNYQTKWPFHVLITQNVFKQYNKIFSFLFSIRRAKNEIDSCLALQFEMKKHAQFEFDSRVWQICNHMSFLINNLQFYFQADVLETQFNEMIAKIRATKDFEQIRHTHDVFLIRVQEQCFMFERQVSKCLSEMLETCRVFIDLLRSKKDSGERLPKELHVPIKDFQNRTSVLLNVFKTLEKRQGTHLKQLLTRINFNNHFSAHQMILL